VINKKSILIFLIVSKVPAILFSMHDENGALERTVATSLPTISSEPLMESEKEGDDFSKLASSTGKIHVRVRKNKPKLPLAQWLPNRPFCSDRETSVVLEDLKSMTPRTVQASHKWGTLDGSPHTPTPGSLLIKSESKPDSTNSSDTSDSTTTSDEGSGTSSDEESSSSKSNTSDVGDSDDEESGVLISQGVAEELKNWLILNQKNEITPLGAYLLKSKCVARKKAKIFSNRKIGLEDTTCLGNEGNMPYEDSLLIKRSAKDYKSLLKAGILKVQEEKACANKKIFWGMSAMLTAPLIGLALYYMRFKENIPWVEYSKKGITALSAVGTFSYGLFALSKGAYEWSKSNQKHNYYEKWKKRSEWFLMASGLQKPKPL
jgi:hypothetical protein